MPLLTRLVIGMPNLSKTPHDSAVVKKFSAAPFTCSLLLLSFLIHSSKSLIEKFLFAFFKFKTARVKTIPKGSVALILKSWHQ